MSALDASLQQSGTQRLRVQKETLSRMLRDLAERRLVEVAGLEVAILDRAGLLRLLGAPG